MTGQQQFLVGRGNIGEGAPQNQTGGTGQTALLSNGTCFVPTTGTGPTPANWYTVAPQSGVGFLYWIKATDTGGTGTASALTGPSISGFTQMSVASPQCSIPSGLGSRTYSYQISSSATGTPVLSTGTGFAISNSA